MRYDLLNSKSGSSIIQVIILIAIASGMFVASQDRFVQEQTFQKFTKQHFSATKTENTIRTLTTEQSQCPKIFDPALVLDTMTKPVAALFYPDGSKVVENGQPLDQHLGVNSIALESSSIAHPVTNSDTFLKIRYTKTGGFILGGGTLEKTLKLKVSTNNAGSITSCRLASMVVPAVDIALKEYCEQTLHGLYLEGPRKCQFRKIAASHVEYASSYDPYTSIPDGTAVFGVVKAENDVYVDGELKEQHGGMTRTACLNDGSAMGTNCSDVATEYNPGTGGNWEFHQCRTINPRDHFSDPTLSTAYIPPGEPTPGTWYRVPSDNTTGTSIQQFDISCNASEYLVDLQVADLGSGVCKIRVDKTLKSARVHGECPPFFWWGVKPFKCCKIRFI